MAGTPWAVGGNGLGRMATHDAALRHGGKAGAGADEANLDVSDTATETD